MTMLTPWQRVKLVVARLYAMAVRAEDRLYLQSFNSVKSKQNAQKTSCFGIKTTAMDFCYLPPIILLGFPHFIHQLLHN